jgi:DNA-binding CsgD family transcriptional regulator
LELIGREKELAEISRFLDAVPEGPSALLLEGEAGIGKTTVWQAGVGQAQSRGYRVLSCRASASETQLPFTGLSDILANTPEETFAPLPAPQRRAVDVALLRKQSRGPLPDWRAVSLGVLGLLRSLAEAGPVLIAVDDGQWLDTPTARILSFCVRRLGTEPIGVFAAVRGVADRPPILGLDQALPANRLHRLFVEQLSAENLGAVISLRLGTEFPRATLRKLHDISDGNPFYALEIARALERRSGRLDPGEPLPIPARLQDLVSERLAELPPAAREVLRVVSALSQPTAALVNAAVGRADRVRAGLSRSAEAGVLEVRGGLVRFTHPLLASGVYSQIPPEDKQRLHRRLAGVVGDPEERARHLALSVDPPDARVAAALEDGAMRAEARGALEGAAEVLEIAVRFTPSNDNDDLRRRTMEAARLHSDTAGVARARSLLEGVVRREPRGRTRALALSNLALVREQDSALESIALFNQALEEAEDDHILLSSIHYGMSVALATAGDIASALVHARAGLDHADRARDPASMNLAVGNVAWFEMVAGLGVNRSLLERQLVIEAEDPTWGGELPSEDLGTILMWADDLEGARGRLRAQYEGFIHRGLIGSASQARLYLSDVEWRAGRFELAARYADEAIEMLTDAEAHVHLQYIFRGAQAHAVLGHSEQARQEAERGVAAAERVGSPRFAFTSLAVLGHLCLSEGNAAGAHEHLARAVRLARGCGFADPGILRFVPDEIEALITLGETDEAKELLEWWEERSRALDRPHGLASAARCQGLLLASLGDISGAVSSLEDALDQHQRIPDQPFELGRTLLALGEVQRRARHKAAAREALQKALAIFEVCPAPLWAAKAHGELARVGGRAPAPLALTPTEERVAALAATGRTNREIGAALFMTPKTVTWNLSKVYRKLGVRSRTELASELRSRQ